MNQEIQALREEIAKLRERVAVLEARPVPVPVPQPQTFFPQAPLRVGTPTPWPGRCNEITCKAQ